MPLGVALRESNKGNDLSQLHDCALEIERKFDAYRAADIDPQILYKILALIKRIKESKRFATSPLISSRLIELENCCFAAILNHRDAANRSSYFAELRKIPEIIFAIVAGT